MNLNPCKNCIVRACCDGTRYCEDVEVYNEKIISIMSFTMKMILISPMIFILIYIFIPIPGWNI